MSNRTFDNVTLTVKWKPAATRPTASTFYPTEGQDASGYLVENIATKFGQIGKVIVDLKDAAFKEIESSADNYSDSNTKLPTTASVKAFVEGKGYVTSSGVTSITPGDGIVDGSGGTTAITSTGTLKAALQDYTKASVAASTLSNPTANTKFYPVSLDTNGKLAVNVPWTDTVYTHPAGTEKTTQAIYKFKVDGTGHVTDAEEVTVDTTVTASSGNLITSGAVATAISNIGMPMVFKGTVGTAGTVTSLATDGTATVGDTYKVITAGTYGGKTAKVGDVLVCLTKTSNANTWEVIPAGDEDTDTWRTIKVNSTEKLSDGISSGAVDFVDGTNTTVTFNTTGNKIAINATHPSVTAGTDTAPTDTLTYGGTFAAITGITKDTNGHTTAVETTTFTMPAAYTHPTTYTAHESGFYKIANDTSGHVTGATAVAASDVKGLSGIDMTGANGTAAGTHGMVPAPAATDNVKFLKGDGTWAVPTDTKTTVVKATTTKAYLVGSASAPTTAADLTTTYVDDGVYLDTTAGKLYATSMATVDGNVICDGDSLTINCV